MDILDKKIIYLLLLNGRMPYAEIAKRTNTTTDKVLYRIQRLIKKGVILGFRTVLDYSAVGYQDYTIFLRLESFNAEKRQEAQIFLNQKISLIQLSLHLVSLQWQTHLQEQMKQQFLFDYRCILIKLL